MPEGFKLDPVAVYDVKHPDAQLPIWRIQDRHFVHHPARHPDKTICRVTGTMVALDSLRVMAGHLVMGKIQGNEYVRSDGVRFELIEVSPDA